VSIVIIVDSPGGIGYSLNSGDKPNFTLWRCTAKVENQTGESLFIMQIRKIVFKNINLKTPHLKVMQPQLDMSISDLNLHTIQEYIRIYLSNNK
jgi:hypothetical protein